VASVSHSSRETNVDIQATPRIKAGHILLLLVDPFVDGYNAAKAEAIIVNNGN
jgi:hypothetical protein